MVPIGWFPIEIQWQSVLVSNEIQWYTAYCKAEVQWMYRNNMQYMIDHSYIPYHQLNVYVKLGVKMIKIWASVGAASISIYIYIHTRPAGYPLNVYIMYCCILYPLVNPYKPGRSTTGPLDLSCLRGEGHRRHGASMQEAARGQWQPLRGGRQALALRGSE